MLDFATFQHFLSLTNNNDRPLYILGLDEVTSRYALLVVILIILFLLLFFCGVFDRHSAEEEEDTEFGDESSGHKKRSSRNCFIFCNRGRRQKVFLRLQKFENK